MKVRHNNVDQEVLTSSVDNCGDYNLKPAGRLKHFADAWHELTSDNTILSYVSGCEIDFQTFPHQTRKPTPIPFTLNERQVIGQELEKLGDKGVIEASQYEQGQFVSNIFIRPKKNGSHRLILNLKKLNEDVDYHHFKMDTIHTCVALITRGCFMASLDLKDAYYTVPVQELHQKFLKFMWDDKLYKFTCLPNGLACAPRIFTKLMKPVFAHLHEKGHVSSPYLDDSFLVGQNWQECRENVRDTLTILKKLGFIVHEEKSQVQPVQVIEHLGFVFDSVNMCTTVNSEKIMKFRTHAKPVLTKKKLTIRLVAQLIGIMVSCFPGVEYGPLFYRRLEILKADWLKRQKGQFDAHMLLTVDTRSDIHWWIDNIGMGKKTLHGKHTETIKTDASKDGWGAYFGGASTGGRWDHIEKEQSINVLECQAILFGLKAMCRDMSNTHLLVLSDNVTAVAYVNHMGGSHAPKCNDIARDIWLWCIERDIWLTAAHIPGKENIEADAESRIFSDQTEWKLCPTIFQQICNRFCTPDIDLFASRLNYQCEPYVAWRPDPNAKAIDAFCVDWGTFDNVYAFPPFSILTKVLQKFQEDNATGVVVAPKWPTQPWYARLLRMTKAKPMTLPMHSETLTLPHAPGKTHPLGHKMQLMAWHL